MKLAPFLVCLSLIIISDSCSKPPEKKDPPLKNGYIRLGYCQNRVFNNETVKICYDKLIMDSRCPVGGVCIWQGVAVGEFSFYLNNNKHTFALCTTEFPHLPPYKQYSRDTIIGNYKIELQDIDPYPGEDPAPPASASVSVTRL